MRKKIEIEIEEVDQDSSKFVLNYHRHPNLGGVGHISMSGTHNGESVCISIYPSEDLSILTPIVITSMFVFPSPAVNHTVQHESDSPIHASYDITDLIENKDAALEEMKNLHSLMESGKAAFSLMPNSVTKTTSALLNRNCSTFNMMTGLKLLDREITSQEVEKVHVINCAEGISRVLERGGMTRPSGIFSYATPSGINAFFESIYVERTGSILSICDLTEQSEPNPTKKDSDAPDQSQSNPDKVDSSLQSSIQVYSTQEEPSLFSSFFSKVRDLFFSSPAVQPSRKSESSFSGWSSYDSNYAEVTLEISSNSVSTVKETYSIEVSESLISSYETQSVMQQREEEPESSVRISESSLSFFEQGSSDTQSVLQQRDEESDVSYLQRMDAMVN
ncbi:TPA: hypothetical protein ACTXXA_000767 [Legionella anisa]